MITPPRADRAEIARYRADLQAGLTLVRREERAARTGDLRAYEALVARRNELTRRSDRHARSYDFRECGRQYSRDGAADSDEP